MTRGRLLALCGAVLVLIFLLFPLGWMIIGSLVPESQLFSGIGIAPQGLVLDHYRALFDERDFLVPIRNSLIVATLTTLVCVPLATGCAYALARLRLPGSGVILALVLAVSMFPQISIVPPLYLLLREAGLLNSYPGLVLPYLTLTTPLAIWMLTAYFRDLPPDLEQAAHLDGAGHLQVLWQIILPITAPALASTSILMFLYSWNEFLFALSFTLGPERYTVPVAISLFRGRYQVPWGQVLAAAVVATVPVALLVLAFQRRIVAGLTAGATKG